MTASTIDRFTGRAAAYAATRPDYPAALLDRLACRDFLRPGMVVADLGSGTGQLAALFVAAGYRTWGVEPNPEMRAYARARFHGDPNFTAVAGRAEDTGLDARSVDLMVAGQAFHWFDPKALRAELKRILRLPGAVAWVWNSRHESGNPFLEGYEALLVRWGRDYTEVKARYADSAAMAVVLDAPAPLPIEISNVQRLDRSGLRDRLRSCSYLPRSDDPAHERMLADADGLFARHAVDGYVELVYTTQIYAAVPNVLRT